MDTVIHSNRNTNRWVIDLHAFIILEFSMAVRAIKSFICPSEIPELSQGKGSSLRFVDHAVLLVVLPTESISEIVDRV